MKSMESEGVGAAGRHPSHRHYGHESAAGVLGAGALVGEGAAFLRLAETSRPRDASPEAEPYDVIVVGGGQAGLSVGYYLARSGARFLILDANARVGDSWRNRWDSLRLFTAARFDGLAGMPFPASSRSFPTKDEMADFLESYAKRFALPVRNRMRVERLWRDGDRYVIEAGGRRLEASQVVVAMSSYQKGRIPAFAGDLDPGIVQLHSSEYRNPGQLREGSLLIVGAGNSGAEIALDVARGRKVWMSGRDVGHVPFRIDRPFSQLVLVPALFRFVFHRLLTTGTWLGRRVRSKIVSQGGPLIRVKPRDLAAAGVERVPRVAGTRGGRPLLEDGRVLDVANVIWCSGYHPGFSWIDLPVLDGDGEPRQVRGVVESEPGLYFVGLHFLYAFSSTMIHGVARDAEYVARAIARRARRGRRAESGRAASVPPGAEFLAAEREPGAMAPR